MLRTVLCFSLMFILSAMMPLGAQAQDTDEPTTEERADLAHCLRTKGRSGESEEACIFSLASVCMDKPENGSTLGQRLCNSRELVIWDELLNDRYQRLKAAVSKDGAKKLRNIQRTWISWRKAKCEMSYVLFEGGTLAGPLAAGCILKATALRAVELGDALAAVGEQR